MLSPSDSPRAALQSAAVVAIAALVPLLPLLGAPLLVDERVMAFEAVKWLALDPLAPWSEPLGGSGTWRPLLVYLYRVDAEAPAAVRHAVSGALYLALCLGVWGWLRGRVPASAATWGAAWFAVHGAHVAVGGWVGGRADLAMGLVAVGALAAWDRGRWGVSAVLAATAVLFKETAVVLPAVLWVLSERGRGRQLAVAAAAAGAAFAASLAIQEVDPGYLPTPAALGRAALAWPLFAVEAVAPLFRPLGVPRGVDGVGLVVAIVVVGVVARRGPPRVPVAAAALAAVPVLHVLPNDGGQWYLLLPTIPLALLWGPVLSSAPRRRSAVLVAAFALVSLQWSSQWAAASAEVDAAIRAGVEGPPPPRQDPRDWPHLGPSLCCGLPYQLYADPRAVNPAADR